MKRWLAGAWGAGCALIGLAAETTAWAQSPATGDAWRPTTFVMSIVSTLVFSIIGIVIAILGFKLFDAAIHFNLEAEICEKQNIAVAILAGAMILGISLIIAATVLS
jgi:hypothetical protein